MLAIYMDHHIPRSITDGLRLRGVDVITAYEDGSSDMDDSALLDRAGELGHILFTQDDDLMEKDRGLFVKRRRRSLLTGD